MRTSLRLTLLMLFLAFYHFSFAQSTTLSGTVRNNATGEAVPAVSVAVKGGTAGTFTDGNGAFRIAVPQLPAVLVFSSVEYETQELPVSAASSNLEISFVPRTGLGQEVVVSATRTPQRILESPVTVERVNAAAIRNAPAATFYDVVANIKGVDIVTSSLTFKTPTTRGFSQSGNLRLNQLVDGMDNQAPGLNFSVGGIIGLSELDVESVELLPGASSALYGPGGMNGTLLINSKNPFRYQGLSVQVKQGAMHVDGKYRDPSLYTNWNVRWAQKIGEKFAFKITSELINAKDWLAADYRNYKRLGTTGDIIGGTRENDPNYDGVNVYGDETTADIGQVLQGIGQQAPFLQGYISTLMGQEINVSRTGYAEEEIISPNTINYKITGALHYKLNPGLEAVFAAYWGTGNTVYTGSDRYSLKDLKIGQYKLELNSSNWFVRGYTTQENAGQSFNATVTTQYTNEAWKPSGGAAGWFAQYGQAYLAAKLAGSQELAAHQAARAVADEGRPEANSEQFRQVFDRVRKVPISSGGGLFVDKTNLYNVEGQYNLSSFTSSFADILIGGNFKKYVLNSEGTLFADSAGTIGINEFGAYIQASRSLFKERVRFTFSGRYDKNQNFKGRFTPRATALIKLSNNNNLRLSYQTAYRFPSTQQQWINLVVAGGVKLIGGNKSFADYYNFKGNPIYRLDSFQLGKIARADFGQSKPESVQSYEVGYKGLIGNKMLIDVYGYRGEYTDFIIRNLVVQSKTGNPADLSVASNRTLYSIPGNNPTKVKTYGFGLSLDYRLPKGFVVSGNFSSDVLQDIAEELSAFNSPKYRGNVAFGNSGLGSKKLLGFNVVYKWQDDFFYVGDFANGRIEDVHTVDAQVSYRMPAIKSVFKIGTNNLANQYYRTAAGNPSIGGLYYVSYGYNIF
jgi:outer membrane receptor protein involved in Fe transport